MLSFLAVLTTQYKEDGIDLSFGVNNITLKSNSSNLYFQKYTAAYFFNFDNIRFDQKVSTSSPLYEAESESYMRVSSSEEVDLVFASVQFDKNCITKTVLAEGSEQTYSSSEYYWEINDRLIHCIWIPTGSEASVNISINQKTPTSMKLQIPDEKIIILDQEENVFVNKKGFLLTFEAKRVIDFNISITNRSIYGSENFLYNNPAGVISNEHIWVNGAAEYIKYNKDIYLTKKGGVFKLPSGSSPAILKTINGIVKLDNVVTVVNFTGRIRTVEDGIHKFYPFINEDPEVIIYTDSVMPFTISNSAFNEVRNYTNSESPYDVHYMIIYSPDGGIDSQLRVNFNHTTGYYINMDNPLTIIKASQGYTTLSSNKNGYVFYVDATNRYSSFLIQPSRKQPGKDILIVDTNKNPYYIFERIEPDSSKIKDAWKGLTLEEKYAVIMTVIGVILFFLLFSCQLYKRKLVSGCWPCCCICGTCNCKGIIKECHCDECNCQCGSCLEEVINEIMCGCKVRCCYYYHCFGWRCGTYCNEQCHCFDACNCYSHCCDSWLDSENIDTGSTVNMNLNSEQVIQPQQPYVVNAQPYQPQVYQQAQGYPQQYQPQYYPQTQQTQYVTYAQPVQAPAYDVKPNQ